MHSIYIMEYYSAIKRNQVLISATMWMNLKNIPSEKKSDTKCHILHASMDIEYPEDTNP